MPNQVIVGRTHGMKKKLKVISLTTLSFTKLAVLFSFIKYSYSPVGPAKTRRQIYVKIAMYRIRSNYGNRCDDLILKGAIIRNSKYEFLSTIRYVLVRILWLFPQKN